MRTWETFYRYLFKIPAHDPRLATMSEYEFEYEVMTYRELEAVLEGRKTLAPTTAMLDEVRKLNQETVPITPEEMGWVADE